VPLTAMRDAQGISRSALRRWPARRALALARHAASSRAKRRVRPGKEWVLPRQRNRSQNSKVRTWLERIEWRNEWQRDGAPHLGLRTSTTPTSAKPEVDFICPRTGTNASRTRSRLESRRSDIQSDSVSSGEGRHRTPISQRCCRGDERMAGDSDIDMLDGACEQMYGRLVRRRAPLRLRISSPSLRTWARTRICRIISRSRFLRGEGIEFGKL